MKPQHCLLLAPIFAAALTTFVVGQPIASAENLDIETLQTAAGKGDAEAQFALAKAYAQGTGGLAQDLAKAADLYRLSAGQGNVKAQNNLGVAYLEGLGVPKDEQEAAKWLRQAAEQGSPLAQDSLGLLLTRGTTLPHNAPEAIAWFEKAARQGSPEAQLHLGELYLRDTAGLKPNYTEALAWFTKAAAQKSGAANLHLDEIYRRGLGVAKDTKRADEFLRAAAEQGDVVAQRKLGEFYVAGAGSFERDLAKAWFWLTLSAEKGYVPARQQLVELENTVLRPEDRLAGQRLLAEYKAKHAGVAVPQ